MFGALCSYKYTIYLWKGSAAASAGLVSVLKVNF